MITTPDYEEVKNSFYEHMEWTKKHTKLFSKDINLTTINDTILFCQDIINIVDTFYASNSKNLNKLSEEQEFSLFLYENERLLDKGEILNFLSKKLLPVVYKEATTSQNVNKFEQANIKENLENVFVEYMNLNAYTVPYLKPYLKENINKKITEKIAYNEKLVHNVKNKTSTKLFK
jgi:hypothetical protein